MLITGEFRNIDNDLISVRILTDGDDSTTLEIGENGLFFSSEPVEIETDIDNTFDHIIRKSATINLVCNDYFGDILWASNSRTSVINIYNNGSCVFAGYLEPGTFSQPFSKPLEEFSVNAVDALSTLQYYKYKNATLTNYDAIKTTLSTATFKEMLEDMFEDIIENLNISGSNATPKLIYDCSKGISRGNERSVFADLAESETYIFGDEFDKAMTQEDVLKEILQYLNLHIIQEGYNFYIFDWNTLKNGRNTWFDVLNSTSLTLRPPSTIALTSTMHASDDTNITVDDVYNQISVTCAIEDEDLVVESPLEDKSITSLYRNKQLYCREYYTELQSNNLDSDDTEPLRKLLAGEYINKKESDYTKSIDWYVQAVYNNKWKFHLNNGEGDITDIYQMNSDGVYVNQWDVPKYVYDNRLTPCLFKFGKVDRKTNSLDDEPTGKVSMSNYLYISINGNGVDDNTTSVPTPAQLESHAPMIEYVAPTSGTTFSPADDDTTNYLVFTGKMTMQTRQAESAPYSEMYNDAITLSKSDFYTKYVGHPGATGIVDFWGNGDEDYKGRLYTRKFFTIENCKDPVDETLYLDRDYSIQPPAEPKMKLYKYQYSEHEWAERTDLVAKLPLLECELIIGNKRLIETEIDQYGHSTFQWVALGQEPTIEYENETYTITTFTLGINPKFDDLIVGKEYKMQNTISVNMNLDMEGTAIPITKNDALKGAVIFRILGPVNNTWNHITRRHPTWFRHTEWHDNNKILLAHCGNIVIEDFSAKIASDGAGTSLTGEEKDLIYMSDETDKFINKNDETTFKFITQLTSEEANAKSIKQSLFINAVINNNTDTPLTSIYNATTNETAKAEEHYVDAYYREYSEPKLLMETTLHNNNINWRNKYTSSILNRTFYVQSINQNLKYNNATITLKEV